jgi:hypothetical protein
MTTALIIVALFAFNNLHRRIAALVVGLGIHGVWGGSGI